MKAKYLFAVMCAVMMGFSVAANNKEEVKKADADVVEKSLTIFENGSFYDEVIEHAAGSDITDGKWHNNAKWNASRALIKSSVDLSTYESIEITYTNVGTATWAQFGLGVQGGKGGTIEFDYVETGKSLTSDGAEHSVVINLSEFSSATSVKCSWGGTHDKTLDMSSINGFSINAGDVTVNVSKIIAKKHETISTISKELTILKDGSFYSEQFSLNLSTFDGGVWKNDGSYNHSRIVFKDALDLTNYETIEITYTATGTWNNKPMIGIGNNPSSSEYDYVAIEKSIDITGKESVVVLNVSDYLTTQVSCSWSKTHEGKLLDITQIKGFSVNCGTTTMSISSIVAKSSLLQFVDEVNAFNLCDATIEQIQAMIEEYNLVLAKNANAGNYQLDENTTLAQRMDYMEMILNKKVADSNKTVGSGVVIQTNKTDKESLIALIAIIGVLSVSAYYFIEKRKMSNK